MERLRILRVLLIGTNASVVRVSRKRLDLWLLGPAHDLRTDSLALFFTEFRRGAAQFGAQDLPTLPTLADLVS